MRSVRLAILALTVAGAAVVAAVPAHADDDGWHHGWREHEGWHGRWHRGWHGDDDDWRRPWGVAVAPPPVYYAPPPPVYYAPPPPPVMYAPGLSIGIGVR